MKKKLFIKFLKENDVYEKYRYYMGNQFNTKDLDNHKNYVLWAFPWAYTYEGVNFWKNIHNKWIKILENI